MSARVVRIEIQIDAVDNTNLDTITSAFNNLERTVRRANNVIRNSGSGLRETERQSSRLEQSTRRVQGSLREVAGGKYQAALEVLDRASPILNTIKGGIKSVAGKTWNILMKAKDLATAPIRGVINLLKNPILQAGAVLGISLGFKDTVDTFANFEAAMSQVKAISGANQEEFTALNAKAKEMGATTKFTATESAEAFNYMAMAGWETQDMLNGIPGIMALAAASGESLATTSDIVTDALTAYGLTAKDSGHFSDVMAQAAASANTNVALMGETFKYVAPVAGALNYSIEDSALAIGLMGNASIKGSRAGTALKTALANLAAPTDKMQSAMDKYGLSLTDGQGNMKSLKGVMDNMRGSLGQLSEKEQTAAASTIFGKEAMAGMLAIINASAEDYDKLTEAVYNADGASKQMSDTMLDNLQGAFTLLQSAAEGVKLSLGERFKPYLMELATWLTDKMPDIERGLMRFMDSVDRKITDLRTKIKEFTSSVEWKDADFFGKVKIAWDEIVAKPFDDWWSSKGQGWFASKALSIGKGLGTGLSTGLLTLLGIDVKEGMDQGASVGRSFAQGFIDGFNVDAVQSALGRVFQGMFSNASKLLPGGEAADLSSLLSAGFLVKTMGPLLSAGIGGAKLGKALFGSTTRTEDGTTTVIPGIGRRLIGSAGAGTGLLGLGANTAMRLGAGNLASGASLGAGALSGIGLGSIAGGVIGGATLISGGADLYRGYKATNQEEANVYTEAGAQKVGGVAAGATIGAGIGALIGPLGMAAGALIGAGIGGIAGWFSGEGKKEEYEENLRKAEEAAARLKLEEEQAKYESQELKDALADGTFSEELFQKAVADKMRSNFGDIELSLQEIRSLAEDLVFDNNIKAVNTFAEAFQTAESSFSALKNNYSNMERLNWKASLGLTFDDSDKEQYKAGADAMVQSTLDYLENKHYEAQMAISLLVDGGTPLDMSSGLNAMYANMQEQVSSLGEQLTSKIDIALEDSIITIDEQAEIQNLQDQINSITEKVAQAKTNAGFEKLKIKYGGDKLTADSFVDMQTELQQQVATATQTYDEALEVGITNLNLQLSEGAINHDQYQSQLTALTEGYEAKIEELNVRVESFQLDTIAESFGSELDGILPEIEGTTAEKLSTALHNALASGVDVANWDTETAAEWLGLESLGQETQSAVAQMMSGVAETIPESIQTSLQEGLQASMEGLDLEPAINTALEGMDIGTTMMSAFTGMDLSGVGTSMGSSIGAAIQNTDMGPINSAVDTVKSNTGAAVDSAYAPGFDTSTAVRITADYSLVNPTATINFSGGGSGTATVSASIGTNAEGSIVDGPLLSWVGEDGPEAIIPLGSKRRQRGIDLWQQAGRMLGVAEYANGGMVGKTLSVPGASFATIPADFTDDEAELPAWQNPESTQAKESRSGAASAGPIKIDVTLNPSFQINGGGEDANIVELIKTHLLEMTDEIAANLANDLQDVFSNMPKEA